MAKDRGDADWDRSVDRKQRRVGHSRRVIARRPSSLPWHRKHHNEAMAFNIDRGTNKRGIFFFFFAVGFFSLDNPSCSFPTLYSSCFCYAVGEGSQWGNEIKLLNLFLREGFQFSGICCHVYMIVIMRRKWWMGRSETIRFFLFQYEKLM